MHAPALRRNKPSVHFFLRVTLCAIHVPCEFILGSLMSNSVNPMVVGHWSDTGVLRWIPNQISSSNVFMHDRARKGELPAELFRALIDRFSDPEGWILSKTNGNTVFSLSINVSMAIIVILYCGICI